MTKEMKRRFAKLAFGFISEEGNDTKYRTSGKVDYYKVTKLLKIHGKLSGVPAEVLL